MKAILLLIIAALPLFAGLRYQPGEKFMVAQLRHAGDWETRTQGIKALMIELMNRTSINASILPKAVSASDPDLFYYPFLLLTGSQDFPPFSTPERIRLKRYLEYGGTLIIDNSGGARDNGFDRSVRRELSSLFPDKPLSVLSADHSIYRSFYLMNRTYFGGRVKAAPWLEGITLDDMTPVIYSQNDAFGAMIRSEAGAFLYDVLPGGEMQRQDAFKFGVNAVMYAMTMNYKKDAVHMRALLKRKRR